VKKQTEEPGCRSPHTHSWFHLGREDNGEEVSRCGSCLSLKYEKDGRVRYEVPE
jgi:hypothetical protein